MGTDTREGHVIFSGYEGAKRIEVPNFEHRLPEEIAQSNLTFDRCQHLSVAVPLEVVLPASGCANPQ